MRQDRIQMKEISMTIFTAERDTMRSAVWMTLLTEGFPS